MEELNKEQKSVANEFLEKLKSENLIKTSPAVASGKPRPGRKHRHITLAKLGYDPKMARLFRYKDKGKKNK